MWFYTAVSGWGWATFREATAILFQRWLSLCPSAPVEGALAHLPQPGGHRAGTEWKMMANGVGSWVLSCITVSPPSLPRGTVPHSNFHGRKVAPGHWPGSGRPSICPESPRPLRRAHASRVPPSHRPLPGPVPGPLAGCWELRVASQTRPIYRLGDGNPV